jgi:LPXTG-motif cell wall-anchored protein
MRNVVLRAGLALVALGGLADQAAADLAPDPMDPTGPYALVALIVVVAGIAGFFIFRRRK